MIYLRSSKNLENLNLENFEISQANLARFRDFEILEMSSLLYTIIIKNGCHDTLSLSYQSGFQSTLGAIPQLCHVSVHTVYNNSFGTLLSFLLSWKPSKSTQQSAPSKMVAGQIIPPKNIPSKTVTGKSFHLKILPQNRSFSLLFFNDVQVK